MGAPGYMMRGGGTYHGETRERTVEVNGTTQGFVPLVLTEHEVQEQRCRAQGIKTASHFAHEGLDLCDVKFNHEMLLVGPWCVILTSPQRVHSDFEHIEYSYTK